MTKTGASPKDGGNISSLYRTGEQADRTAYDMDILSYAYQGGNGNSNLLIDVSDAASVENSEGFIDGNTNPNQKDYSYDANGNMVKDRNKGIKTITYNHLNLPLRISMTNFQFIDYQYNALGQKVSKTVTDNAVIKVVDYLDASAQLSTGSFQYAGEVLQFFPHAEGYVTAVGKKQVGSEGITGYKYRHIYNYTDHLGNVRLSFSTRSNGRLEVMNENHYFPFGLKHTVYVPPTKQVFVLKPGESEFDQNVVTKTPYLYEFNDYGGKSFEKAFDEHTARSAEWQDELGLNMNDFGARNYDPALGRWMNIDPLAEVSRRFSPYTYALNNPVYFIDPDGMTAESSTTVTATTGVSLAFGVSLDSVIEGGAAVDFSGEISFNVSQGNNNDSFNVANNDNGNPKNGDPKNGDPKNGGKSNQENPNPWDLNGDGILQKNEADYWYIKGEGKSIIVDGNKIDLTGIDTADLIYNKKTNTYSLNTTKAFIQLPYETAATYGGSTFKLVDGKWQMQPQEYHYRMRDWNSVENIGRNILTIVGDPTQTIRPSQMNTVNRQISSKGTSYFINIKY